jgi:hypothetical protein
VIAVARIASTIQICIVSGIQWRQPRFAIVTLPTVVWRFRRSTKASPSTQTLVPVSSDDADVSQFSAILSSGRFTGLAGDLVFLPFYRFYY